MKKAIMANTLIVLILGLVFLAGGIGIITGIFNSKMDENAIDTLCQVSVIQNSMRPAGGLTEIADAVKVKCPTKYTTFHEDYAEQEFETDPKSEKDTPVKLDDKKYLDKEGNLCDKKDEACMFRNINKMMADDMARCWKNFQMGQRRVFSLYKNNVRQCMVCSVFFFDSEIVDKYGDMGLVGFSEPDNEDYSLDKYMRQNKNLLYTGDKTYYEFTLDPIDKGFEYPYYDYDVNNEYAVVFIAMNKGVLNEISENLWDKVKQFISDTEYVEEEEGNFINVLEFIPNSEVGTVCDEWA